MNSHGLALLAIDWSKRLPPEMLGSVPLRFALADSYVRLRDWAALQAMLQRGAWERGEPIRRALLAKAARETGDDIGFEKNWVAAVAAAEGDAARLNLLQTIAFQWNWPEQGNSGALDAGRKSRRATRSASGALSLLRARSATRLDFTARFRDWSQSCRTIPQ